MAMRATSPRPRGFTLIELLVVMSIIATLAGLIIPAVAMARRGAKRIACMNNLRQVGMATMGYADDWHGFLPAEGNKGIDDPEASPAWFYRLPPYLDGKTVQDRTTVFQCTEFAWTGGTVFDAASPKSFKLNAWIDNGGRPQHHFLGSIHDESAVVGFFDAIGGETGNGQLGNGTPSSVDAERHAGKVNVLALDGHTLSLGSGDADTDWEDELHWLSEEW